LVNQQTLDLTTNRNVELGKLTEDKENKMAKKEKVLSSASRTSSAPIQAAKPAAPASKPVAQDTSNKYKEALEAIVKASEKVASATGNRNFRIELNQAISAAKALL
tara:strand:+ start:3857 stop:4174 length:318 start_codon:yes stop_codon:yes gene_type:complete